MWKKCILFHLACKPVWQAQHSDGFWTRISHCKQSSFIAHTFLQNNWWRGDIRQYKNGNWRHSGMLATWSHTLYTFQSAIGNDRMKKGQSDPFLTHASKAEPSTDTEIVQEASRHWSTAVILWWDWQCHRPAVQGSRGIWQHQSQKGPLWDTIAEKTAMKYVVKWLCTDSPPRSTEPAAGQKKSK